MKGCHNCKHNGVQFDSWENSPCASCTAADSMYGATNLDDVSYSEEFADKSSPLDILIGQELKPLEELPELMSRCILHLVELYEHYPETYKVVMLRIRKPGVGLRALAHECRMSHINFIYHLKKAKKLYPELSKLLSMKNCKTLSEMAVTFSLANAVDMAVDKLTDLRKEAPVTFNIVKAKIEKPFMSFSELGQKFGYSKQNIDYHLKKARKLMKVLSSAILIDRRFLGGK